MGLTLLKINELAREQPVAYQPNTIDDLRYPEPTKYSKNCLDRASLIPTVLATGKNIGPFFLQQRVGKGGRLFTIFKLTTMNSKIIVSQELHQKAYEVGKYGVLEDDPRITVLGRKLRACWIDEIPQLVNLLKGDLRLIGVRPLPLRELNSYPESFQDAYKLYRPGLINILYLFDVRGVQERLRVMEQFFFERAEHPILTDLKYLIRFISGVIRGKIRGI